jgi:hypothetical protein
MPKLVIPFNQGYFDRVMGYMRQTHVLAVAKASQSQQIQAPAIIPDPPKPVYSARQQRIIDGFKKWTYGCQTENVRELVAAMMDLPVDALIPPAAAVVVKEPEVRFGREFPGMFVKFVNRDRRYDVRLPRGTILYVQQTNEPSNSWGSGSRGLTADMHGAGVVDDIRLKGRYDPSWKNTLEIATDDEIDYYFKGLVPAVTLLGRWNFFVDAFNLRVSINGPIVTN